MIIYWYNIDYHSAHSFADTETNQHAVIQCFESLHFIIVIEPFDSLIIIKYLLQLAQLLLNQPIFLYFLFQ